jgi:hypothetical protein
MAGQFPHRPSRTRRSAAAYRTSDLAGTVTGKEVGKLVVQHFLKPIGGNDP